MSKQWKSWKSSLSFQKLHSHNVCPPALRLTNFLRANGNVENVSRADVAIKPV